LDIAHAQKRLIGVARPHTSRSCFNPAILDELSCVPLMYLLYRISGARRQKRYFWRRDPARTPINRQTRRVKRAQLPLSLPLTIIVAASKVRSVTICCRDSYRNSAERSRSGRFVDRTSKVRKLEAWPLFAHLLVRGHQTRDYVTQTCPLSEFLHLEMGRNVACYQILGMTSRTTYNRGGALTVRRKGERHVRCCRYLLCDREELLHL